MFESPRVRAPRPRRTPFWPRLSLVVLLVAACQGAGSPTAPATATTGPLGASAPAVSPAVSASAAPPSVMPTAPSQLGATAPPPSPTAAASAAPVVAEFSATRALEDVRQLSEVIGPRVAGTAGRDRAATYLSEQLSAAGYSVSYQEFDLPPSQQAQVSLAVQGDPSPLAATPVIYSPSGDVSGPLVDAGLGRASDLPASGLQGAVALVRRGTIAFREKVETAAAAGARAVVISNDRAGPLVNASLERPGPIPAVGVTQADGDRLRQRLAGGGLTAQVRVEAAPAGKGRNVMGVRRGSGDRELIVGGHYDTVPLAPGANDNASGTATALEVARVLAQTEKTLTVRFIAFDGEEVGLVGSTFYALNLPAAERGTIVAFLNCDALAVGDSHIVHGDKTLSQFALEGAQAAGVPLTSVPDLGNSSSDHVAFLTAGIPAILIGRFSDPRLHTPDDQLRYIQPERLEASGKVVLAVAARLPRG